ncbi:hypothetical protein HAX54_000558 [Datura stramonium]|uniref:Uncharacterized protein n=1 Tax=Datura stramonium TaxID=4076 RepID=A0ABS8T184_DATST|nr:hypothetical protein [Datura stramonium]
MDIRLIINPNFKSFAVYIIPSLVPVNRPVQTDSASSLYTAAAVDDNDGEPPKMTLIFWNCRGSEQPDFHTNSRSMLDYHRPALVLFLETHMTKHQYPTDDFKFTNITNVPVIGENFGGMTLVWENDLVTVDGLMINNKELHCTIKVSNFASPAPPPQQPAPPADHGEQFDEDKPLPSVAAQKGILPKVPTYASPPPPPQQPAPPTDHDEQIDEEIPIPSVAVQKEILQRFMFLTPSKPS